MQRAAVIVVVVAVAVPVAGTVAVAVAVPVTAAVAVAVAVAAAETDAVIACPAPDPRIRVSVEDGQVRLSRDGGASYAVVLDGPGRLDATALDCFGRLYALRDGDRLGVLSGGDEAWHTVTGFADVPALISGGPALIAVGPADDEPEIERTGYSGDGGATWRYRDRWE